MITHVCHVCTAWHTTRGVSQKMWVPGESFLWVLVSVGWLVMDGWMDETDGCAGNSDETMHGMSELSQTELSKQSIMKVYCICIQA